MLKFHSFFILPKVIYPPKQKTPQSNLRCFFFSVGLPGIEPEFYEPESHVIPLYHSPWFIFFVDLRGLEPLASTMRMWRSTR